MSKVAKTTFVVMVLTILSKVLGLVREQVLAAAYGTSMYADAYITAMKMPNMLFAAIGAAIATSLIPIYSKVNEEQGTEKAQSFLNNLINAVVIICIGIVIVGLLFTEPLVKAFAMGFEGEKLAITINFVRIILFAVIFIGINNIVASYLQLNNNFVTPGLIGIPLNIIIIISIILSLKTNVYVLIIGSLIGLASQVIFQIPAIRKFGYRYKFKLDLTDENMKHLVVLVLPVVIGVGVEQINTLVDGTLASTFGNGVVSAFNYANRLYGFVSALFVSSILSVIYPLMAKSIVSNNHEEFKNAIKKTMNSILLFIIPISAGTMVLAEPIVKVLFERGKFNAHDTAMTSSILIIYMISIIAFSLRHVISKAFYSLHDTKTPMVNGAIAIVLNIILNIMLSKYFGYIGLAIATTIAAFIGLGLFYVNLKKKIGSFGGKNILLTSIKCSISSVLMGIVTIIVYKYLESLMGIGLASQVITLGTSILVGAIVYGVCVIILKVEEVSLILNIVKKKIKKS